MCAFFLIVSATAPALEAENKVELNRCQDIHAFLRLQSREADSILAFTLN